MSLASKINELSSSNNALATTVDKLMINFSSLTLNLSAKQTNESSTVITTSLLSVMNEEKEKEDLRRLNLIIHNLEEPMHEDGLERKHANIQKVSKVIYDYLGVSATINNVIRWGAKLWLLKISVDTPRPKLPFYIGALLCVVTRTQRILGEFI